MQSLTPYVIAVVLLAWLFAIEESGYGLRVGSDMADDTLAYRMKHDSLWDSGCIDSGQGCSYIDIVYPVFAADTLSVVDSIHSSVLNWCSANTIGEGTALSIKQVMQDFITEYQDYAADAEYQAFPWFSEIFSSVVANTPRLVCIHIGQYSFTGGAHGNSYVSFQIFQRPSGKRVAWQSLFIAGAADSISKHAEAIFRENAMMEPDETYEQAGFWFEDGKFHLNDNVGVSKDGLIFYYNSYEIAPYVYGPTELVIPWSLISEFAPENSPLFELVG